MKIQLSPLVLYVQILVIFGHECYIESSYGSLTTHRYNKLSKQTIRAKVRRGGNNRSVAILTDLPVYILFEICMLEINIIIQCNLHTWLYIYGSLYIYIYINIYKYNIESV